MVCQDIPTKALSQNTSGMMPNRKSADIPPVELAYVFNGGSLLHQVPWSKGQKYSQLAQSYVDYILLESARARTVL